MTLPMRTLPLIGTALIGLASCPESAPQPVTDAPTVEAPRAPLFEKPAVIDWCNEHSLPKSQRVECHPELRAKLAAMAPKSGG